MLIRNGIAVWSAREMNLRECYEWVRRIDPDLDIDSFEVAEEVSRLRQFWKPETVRVVLLAESHAYTSQKDFVDWEATDSPYHGKFVRFVYCLANGENTLVSSPVSRNPGTSQFWKILYSCLHKVSTKEDFGPLLRSTSTEKRIGKKIELLHGLRQAGIWLMDGSIVGINRKSPSLRKKILIKCWNYTHSTLQNLNPRPEQIVVIGCLVKKALKNQLDSLGIKCTTLPQPQAHIPASGYFPFYDVYYQICSPSGTAFDNTAADPSGLPGSCKE